MKVYYTYKRDMEPKYKVQEHNIPMSNTSQFVIQFYYQKRIYHIDR